MPDLAYLLSDEVLGILKKNEPLKQRCLSDYISRMIDLILALAGMVIISPLLLIFALLIKMQDGGTVFFKQDRMGLDGEPFKIIKFRTMCANAEKIGAGLRMIKDDPRVTTVGKIMRDYHLDEFPQLLNVIKGDMSLVGPRPALVFQKEYYEPWEIPRLKVRPGMTGLSQVMGGNSLNWDSRIVIDVYYVRNRNIRLYFKVLWLTIIRVFQKSGVYATGGEVAGWTRPVPIACSRDDTEE